MTESNLTDEEFVLLVEEYLKRYSAHDLSAQFGTSTCGVDRWKSGKNLPLSGPRKQVVEWIQKELAK
jgi:hypothetical protein